MEGTIKSIIAQKGFCFITPLGENKDIFCHFTGFIDWIQWFESLQINDKVWFDIVPNNQGNKAINVGIIQ